MNSYPNSRKDRLKPSLADQQLFLTPVSGETTENAVPGTFNDEVTIRSIITKSIRNCGKSREVIAEEMTYLMGSTVTKRALDSYTSESADQNRFPAQYIRAFCEVTKDFTLIHCVAELAGLHTIDENDQKLLELGRQYLAEKRAAEAKRRLEEELGGLGL